MWFIPPHVGTTSLSDIGPRTITSTWTDSRGAGHILDKGFVKGIEEFGDLFAKGEFFLPELVQGAEAMKVAVAVLDPALKGAKEGRRSMGSAVAARWRAISTRPVSPSL